MYNEFFIRSFPETLLFWSLYSEFSQKTGEGHTHIGPHTHRATYIYTQTWTYSRPYYMRFGDLEGSKIFVCLLILKQSNHHFRLLKSKTFRHDESSTICSVACLFTKTSTMFKLTVAFMYWTSTKNWFGKGRRKRLRFILCTCTFSLVPIRVRWEPFFFYRFVSFAVILKSFDKTMKYAFYTSVYCNIRSSII